jgi:hypothetical protein
MISSQRKTEFYFTEELNIKKSSTHIEGEAMWVELVYDRNVGRVEKNQDRQELDGLTHIECHRSY